jgi:tetratricopeptide (TPR) repeat protein
MKYTQYSIPSAALTLICSLFLTPACVEAQEIEVTSQEPAAVLEVSPELMQSFLHLQEQVHATQMAVERSRLEAEVAAARNTDALNARLAILENALDQAQRNSSTALVEAGRQIQDSNRQTMLFAGFFASIGFLALAATAWFQWKTTNHLSALPSQMGFPALLEPRAYQSLGSGPSSQIQSERMRDALGRLEHRIAGLETGHPEPAPEDEDTSGDVNTPRTELNLLIREGEKLLAHEDAQKAIEHFDAILQKHPGHPEVLLHKGAALERLQRDQEAIECYDQAIRADKSLTMAYLHKGGLYNRMEKFNEAMQCYEQALKVQEGRTAIN